MSISIIESGGPMWLKPLSDERVQALMAVDRHGIELPPELTRYLIHLENSYHDLRRHHNSEFLRSTWEAREAKTTGSPSEASACTSEDKVARDAP